ncbi:uncharacterized protein LOC132563167 [Ylistrum balloti]|uniref:uncharacterized protein LOC132563167 n=1 Tax=Ylistrum balloti TaxID=509963 RepID=UPI00290590FB|nr:uncharacterized protein LOC132563167 [Ylistrum balloti]
MALVQLVCLASLCMTSLWGVVQTVKIRSYNVALLNLIAHYEDRKPNVIQALQSQDYDVMCLQEVWYGSDVSRIRQTLGSSISVHTAPLYQETMFWDWINAPPCHKAAFTVACIFIHCSSITSKAALTNCSVGCGMMSESQACISCLVVSGKGALRCFDYTRREAMNVPGVVLLSKKKVNSVRSVFFEPNVKQILRRAYIEAEIEGVGTVICSHTASNIGDEYYEPNLRGVYSSWEEQNLADSRKLTEAARLSYKPLIMGDLNTSPSIPVHNVTADFEDAYNHFLSEGFVSPYVTMVGKCTYCLQNPLTHGSNHSHVLDHVFVRDHAVLSAKRLYVEDIPNLNFPMSDHYGIEVEVASGYL